MGKSSSLLLLLLLLLVASVLLASTFVAALPEEEEEEEEELFLEEDDFDVADQEGELEGALAGAGLPNGRSRFLVLRATSPGLRSKSYNVVKFEPMADHVAVTWRGQVLQGQLSVLNGIETVSWTEPDDKERSCFLRTQPGHGWNHLVSGKIGSLIDGDFLLGKQFQVHNPASKAAAFTYLNGRVAGALLTQMARAVGGNNELQVEEDWEEVEEEEEEEEV